MNLAAIQDFAAQAARERQTLARKSIQPYTGAGAATKDGGPVDIFLSAVRAEREITEHGYVIVHRAQARILKSCRWQPEEGNEFVVVATGERFRCSTAAGAAYDFAGEIVCDVVLIDS